MATTEHAPRSRRRTSPVLGGVVVALTASLLCLPAPGAGWHPAVPPPARGPPPAARQRTGEVRAHEPSLRVPFLVTGPGMRSGETRYDPISTVDVTATIVETAGARPPRRPEGTSRRQTVREGDRGWQVAVVTEATRGRRSRVAALPSDPDGGPATPSGLPVLARSAHPTAQERHETRALFGTDEERSSIGLRTPRWSFSLHRNGEGELHDMAKDPTQDLHRYYDPDHAAVVEQLRDVWSSYRDCRGAACREPMATDLRAGPVGIARLARLYRQGLRARYGHH